jgi:energy-converting hydrogenase Eha subunit A
LAYLRIVNFILLNSKPYRHSFNPSIIFDLAAMAI